MEEQLFQIITGICPISDELRVDIISKLKRGRFLKKHKILREGEICNYLYFVGKGLLCAYYVLEERELLNWFMMENDFFFSVESFYSRKPSDETIEVLEDCDLLYIHYDDLHWLYNKYIEFNIVGRKLTEAYYVEANKRIKLNRGVSASFKYEYLLHHYSHFFKRVPLKLIANYLGVTPETLSRMRSAIR